MTNRASWGVNRARAEPQAAIGRRPRPATKGAEAAGAGTQRARRRTDPAVWRGPGTTGYSRRGPSDWGQGIHIAAMYMLGRLLARAKASPLRAEGLRNGCTGNHPQARVRKPHQAWRIAASPPRPQECKRRPAGAPPPEAAASAPLRCRGWAARPRIAAPPAGRGLGGRAARVYACGWAPKACGSGDTHKAGLWPGAPRRRFVPGLGRAMQSGGAVCSIYIRRCARRRWLVQDNKVAVPHIYD